MPQPPLVVSDFDLKVAARTLWLECRGEPLVGQQGVAWTIRNRAEHPTWWGDCVWRVCLKEKQFSGWNTGDPNHPNRGLDALMKLTDDAPELVRLREVCRSVFAGEVDDPTGAADHYEVLGTGAAWAKNREFSKVLGRHAFYCLGSGA